MITLACNAVLSSQDVPVSGAQGGAAQGKGFDEAFQLLVTCAQELPASNPLTSATTLPSATTMPNATTVPNVTKAPNVTTVPSAAALQPQLPAGNGLQSAPAPVAVQDSESPIELNPESSSHAPTIQGNPRLAGNDSILTQSVAPGADAEQPSPIPAQKSEPVVPSPAVRPSLPAARPATLPSTSSTATHGVQKQRPAAAVTDAAQAPAYDSTPVPSAPLLMNDPRPDTERQPGQEMDAPANCIAASFVQRLLPVSLVSTAPVLDGAVDATKPSPVMDETNSQPVVPALPGIPEVSGNGRDDHRDLPARAPGRPAVHELASFGTAEVFHAQPPSDVAGASFKPSLLSGQVSSQDVREALSNPMAHLVAPAAAATPAGMTRHLEINVSDGVLGDLSVRAELKAGTLHASVIGAHVETTLNSAALHQFLGRAELPGEVVLQVRNATPSPNSPPAGGGTQPQGMSAEGDGRARDQPGPRQPPPPRTPSGVQQGASGATEPAQVAQPSAAVSHKGLSIHI